MSQPAISVVMVLYGQRAVTERALQSLRLALGDELGGRIELVLVDNASPDSTGELLDAWEHEATVVRQGVNLNFSGGGNAGARVARGETLVFVNNDMEFAAGAIQAVADTATQPGVGAAGARLLFPDGTLQHGGVAWVADGSGVPMPQHIFHHEAGDLAPACAVLELDAVTAAFLAVPRTLFQELGGFDESYRNGLEDMDLCLRVRSAGHRIVYRGDVAVVHHESATRGVDNIASAHNDAVFIARWGGACDADDALAAETFGGELTVRGALPLVAHDWLGAGALSLEGHLRSVAPEAAEARALLSALEVAGLGPCARDRLPTYLTAALGEQERASLERAERRLRSPTALRLEVPVGSLWSQRRRFGDVLRLARPPADPAHLAGVATVLAATPALREGLIDLGFDPARVFVLPPPVIDPGMGAGGGGFLVLLPAHDPPLCAAVLAALSVLGHAPAPLQLLPNVTASGLAAQVQELAPEAELLTPITSEERFAQLAGRADAVLCLDPADVFERRALIAAATGAAVALPGDGGPAAAVLGGLALTGSLADAWPRLWSDTPALRAQRRETVLSACSPQALVPVLSTWVSQL